MTHRAALSPRAYAMLRRRVFSAYGYRCAVCGEGKPLDLDHLQRRSQSGGDTGNVWALCRDCHARRDWPFHRGRLVVEQNAGMWWWAIVTKPDKWEPTPAWTEWRPV